jgi:L-alanine-DL-glutamate epimerase-like enolase superfamily enzyme
VLGGITEWLRVAHAADAFGLQVAPHWHANLHAHLAAAVPNALTIEHFDLAKEQVDLADRDGGGFLPPQPGQGGACGAAGPALTPGLFPGRPARRAPGHSRRAR